MPDSWNVSEWVGKARTDSEKEFRQAVHTLIVAIGSSELLRRKMVVKGGILLALKYEGARYTKDVDFSTSDKSGEIDVEKLIHELSRALAQAVEELDYGLDCRVQSVKKNPKNEDATFPTYEISIGHAYKGSSKHNRLIDSRCPDVLRIDFSLNEIISSEDIVSLSEGGLIRCYSLQDLVAEKYRAIIQQATRNRTRRQDAYDIYKLIESGLVDSNEFKKKTLKTLLEKSKSRELYVHKESLDNKEIMERSQKEYLSLKDEIEGDLPDFDIVFKTVKEYYVSLPWGEI